MSASNFDLLEKIMAAIKNDDDVAKVIQKLMKKLSTTPESNRSLACELINELLDNVEDQQKLYSLQNSLKNDTNEKDTASCLENTAEDSNTKGAKPKKASKKNTKAKEIQVEETPVNLDEIKVNREDLVPRRSGVKRVAEGRNSVMMAMRLRRGGSQTPCAVKRMFLPDKEGEIANEARALVRLRHQNVVRVLGYVSESPALLIMELAELGNFTMMILNHRLTADDHVRIFSDVANAMEYVASKGYVHRNLHTDTILITGKKRAKIGGFRYCRKLNSDGIYKAEDKEMAVMLHAVPPDTMASGVYSERSDVFSFSVACWTASVFDELKHNVFAQLTSLHILVAMYDEYTCTGRLPDKLHNIKDMDELIRTCLSLKPDNRPPFSYVNERLKKLAKK